MRIDIVTIFPAYFDVLAVSLLGRARDVGLLDIRVHDLRDAAADRHRTTDDTPYGGGAGMVMTPEPWGVTLDALLAEPAQPPPVLVFPSPAGHPFRQATARDLAGCERLIFGCGRYEGIDERVVTHYATRTDTRCLSLGDFVLNGGEVAALAMIEAIARLIPGVLGNPASIVEESHEDGLLEYPVYTKPSEWRGLPVPEVLRSGNHAAVTQWRRAEQLRRTQATRPDLLDPNAPRH